MTAIRFTVPGRPVTQGSKKHVGHGRMIEANERLRPWRDSIAWHARQAVPPGWNVFQPMSLDAVFLFPRPASHLLKDGRLRRAAPPEMTSRRGGDLDKLLRALCDALTQSGIWADDSQWICGLVQKKYAPPGQPGGLECWIAPVDQDNPHLPRRRTPCR